MFSVAMTMFYEHEPNMDKQKLDIILVVVVVIVVVVISHSNNHRLLVILLPVRGIRRSDSDLLFRITQA